MSAPLEYWEAIKAMTEHDMDNEIVWCGSGDEYWFFRKADGVWWQSITESWPESKECLKWEQHPYPPPFSFDYRIYRIYRPDESPELEAEISEPDFRVTDEGDPALDCLAECEDREPDILIERHSMEDVGHRLSRLEIKFDGYTQGNEKSMGNVENRVNKLESSFQNAALTIDGTMMAVLSLRQVFGDLRHALNRIADQYEQHKEQP